MKKYPSQEMERFNVRLPAGMRDAIAERAEKHGRSMNSEIVQILQDVLNGPDTVFWEHTLKDMKEYPEIFGPGFATIEARLIEEFKPIMERAFAIASELAKKEVAKKAP
ncbi:MULTISPECIES: Arc family DNA-binding protein [unclassified Photorhabdus]|uniref:Arc family DNA-binding protein n=1 Tax=unclassified Photorhabdus TaxID=2620880 RepID=UPI000DCDEE09|nr:MULTISPECIES: Arc family DNA-binding protein [unclassified Photorhabdus]RAW93976.1 DNA-binding protein [Photorhabdus sp. S9-53]RAW94068.1 DNA-binding protein [Photorhabdus sp. S10-54]RAW97534.1 DNA-binding protein [Photorhabdus sp. S8-52]